MVRIGLAQLLVEGGEPERNFQRAEKLVREAALAGCQVVVLPEVIDFGWTHPSALVEAQPIPGPYSERFRALAAELGLYLCVGLTEKVDETTRYNTALLFNPAGEELLRYHKINLLEVEFPYYRVGNHLAVVDTPLGRIGVNICADNYADSLHIGHVLGRMGAQLLLVPSAWTVPFEVMEDQDPYRNKWSLPFRRLARMHNLVVAACTSVGYIVGGPYEGRKMVGLSMVVGPEGILTQGRFNEFAGDLVVCDVELPTHKRQGTQVGEGLKQMGYRELYND